MPIDLPTYIRHLQDLELVESAGIDFHLERYQNLSKFGGDSAVKFGEELVKAQLISYWQHQRLLAGRAEMLRVAGLTLVDELAPGDYMAVDPATGRRSRLWFLDRDNLPTAHWSPASCARRVQAIASPYVTPLRIAVHHRAEYLIEERWTGESLERVLGGPRQPLEVGRAIRVFGDVARGVAALHTLEYVPSAPYLITPDDVIVTEDGARVSALTLFDPSTRHWSFWSPVNFLAPEAESLDGDAPFSRDYASIYSLGCVLYFALTGEAPFAESDEPGVSRRPEQILLQHLVAAPPSIRSTRPDTPIWLDNLYQQMMAKRPTDRPQSLEAVWQALEQGG